MRVKFKFSFLIVIAFIGLFSLTEVKAAFAYSWTINGETISRGGANSLGTASWSIDDNYSGGVLTLNNYNGGQIKLECFGTGMDLEFAIKLVGDNTITVDSDSAIVAGGKLTFIGDGNLTINARTPITGNFSSLKLMVDNSDKENNNVQNVVIEENQDSTEDVKLPMGEDTEKDKSSDASNFFESKTFSIIVLLYCVVSSIVIVALIIRKNK